MFSKLSSRLLLPLATRRGASSAITSVAALPVGRRGLASSSTMATSNPLSILKQECAARKLCNEQGYRLPKTYWTCSIAVDTSSGSDKTSSNAPNLRTVGLERIDDQQGGVDFCMKRGNMVTRRLTDGAAVSFLHVQGRFAVGEQVEQWRAEGRCVEIPLGEIQGQIPEHVVASMVGSKRLAAEMKHSHKNSAADNDKSPQRINMPNKSHFTEIIQQTYRDLEAGNLSADELQNAMQAFRFVPARIEYMRGGPDSLLWERWEWYSLQNSHGTALEWQEAQRLVPH